MVVGRAPSSDNSPGKARPPRAGCAGAGEALELMLHWRQCGPGAFGSSFNGDRAATLAPFMIAEGFPPRGVASQIRNP